MKKLVLLISLVIPLLFSHVNLNVASAQDVITYNQECESASNLNVFIINNYGVFVGNGFIYISDSTYSYIITSSELLNDVNSYKIVYENKTYNNVKILGSERNYGVSVLRIQKINDVKNICIANSDFLYRGQKVYVKGNLDYNTNYFNTTYINSVGNIYSYKNYIGVHKSMIQLEGDNKLNGTLVYDELERFTGMISGYDSDFSGSCYMIDSNKLVKIADSIIKTGKYNINYIKYSLVDYGILSSRLKKSYGVSNKVNSGVVVVTFKPLKMIFGGLNQGMVITEVNGVKINNTYELDKQLSRYNKKSDVCLTVIKKNGKVAYYYVEI